MIAWQKPKAYLPSQLMSDNRAEATGHFAGGPELAETEFEPALWGAVAPRSPPNVHCQQLVGIPALADWAMTSRGKSLGDGAQFTVLGLF